MVLSSDPEHLDQVLDELYALYELAKVLTSSIELEQVTAHILQGLCGLMGAESSFLYDHELDSGLLRLRGTRGPDLDLPDQIPITSAHWIAQAALAQTPVTWTTGEGTLVASALRTHDVIQAVGGVGDHNQRQFTPAELSRLTSISHLSAMALENARLYRRIQTMAITDGLTGLYNHRHFFDELHREMTRARRYTIPLSLFLLDIDNFKGFNDAFGHVHGDGVLRTVARILGENIRGSDLAARYGGEEFAVILPNAGPAQARRIAERIRWRIAQTVFYGGASITVSIGVAGLVVNQDPEESPQSFAHRADQELYRAKQTSRNRVCVEGEESGGSEQKAGGSTPC